MLLPSFQSPLNRSDKQGYWCSMRRPAFQVIQKVPFPSSFSSVAFSIVSLIIENCSCKKVASFSFHPLWQTLPPQDTRIKGRLTKSKHPNTWNSPTVGNADNSPFDSAHTSSRLSHASVTWVVNYVFWGGSSMSILHLNKNSVVLWSPRK